MTKKKGWRGYIFSRAINGQMIPQRVQNLVLRTYAEKSGLQYLLSATEYHMPGSFMMLESLYPAFKTLEGLLIYSISMLPEKRAQRLKLYEAAFKNKCGIRFALEELALAGPKDVQLIEDVLATRILSKQADVSALEGA
jgi:sporadic carbohydrate cluster protein (TIGR04323 family)